MSGCMSRHLIELRGHLENDAISVRHLDRDAEIQPGELVVTNDSGELRTADVPGVQFYPRPKSQLGTSEPLPGEELGRTVSEQGVADDFHRFVREGIEPGISGRNNLQTLAVCEMLVRSARERRPVERAELD